MTVALVRIALAGAGRRKLAASLTLLLSAVATATLAIALGVGTIVHEPWQRTFEATRGPHVVAFSFGDELAGLAERPGVAAAAGPFRGTLTSLRLDGRRYGVQLQARPAAPAAVDRPVVTSGTWLRPGTVVLERSYARAIGARPGARVVLAGARGPVEAEVAGVAVTLAQSRYPESQPGLAWVLPATLDAVQPEPARRTSTLLLRLADAAAADAFVRAARLDRPPGREPALESWRELRADAVDETRVNQVILATFSILIGVAVAFALASIVGGRILAQARELAVLKAAGFTPVQVATAFAGENVLVAAVGAAAGAVAGAAVAPAFVAVSVELVGAGPRPAFASLTLGLAAVVVIGLVAASSFLPAWRRARGTTSELLAPPLGARRSRVQALARRTGLPAAALVGVKDVFARPGRASLTALSLTLAVAAVVAGLAMEATFELASEPAAPTGPAPAMADAAGEPLTPAPPSPDTDADRLRPLVYGLEAVLVAIALVTLVTTTLFAVRERSRELGILKAIGLTPRQVTLGVAGNHLVLAGIALTAGIPLGLALFGIAYAAAGGEAGTSAAPPVWQLLLLCPLAAAAFAGVAAATAAPAARLPVTHALRYE